MTTDLPGHYGEGILSIKRVKPSANDRLVRLSRGQGPPLRLHYLLDSFDYGHGDYTMQ
jgi:hypothetical protein